MYIFRWQVFRLPCCRDQTSVSMAWITAEGGFISSVKPSGCRRRMWRWVTTNIQCHTHVSHRGHIIFKACRLHHVIRPRPKRKKKADILHSWAHSTKYNNFLEFFDPRRRSQGTSCCPRSTSCSCGSISLPRCHGHWKTLYSCLIGTLAGNAWTIMERRVKRCFRRLCLHQFATDLLSV